MLHLSYYSQLRSEVESWKIKSQAIASIQQSSSQDQHDVTNQQVLQSKRMISQLESEVNKLKDDAIIQSLRHTDELKYINQKHAIAIEEAESSKALEIQEVESRHLQAITALKRIHTDEITSVREVSTHGVINIHLIVDKIYWVNRSNYREQRKAKC